MTALTTLTANVTDTNHQARGAMPIKVEFYADAPVSVIHGGQHFAYTGKAGTNFKTGWPVREMATEKDARLWITLDGQHVWED
jgi:hypothetical protein